MFTALLAALLAQAASSPPPVADVRQLSVTGQTVIAEIDTNKVHGTPTGLAWRLDGTIYLRLQGKDTARHYQIVTVPAVSVAQSDAAPEWAASYWTWKSATIAPGDPTLRLDVEQREDKTRSVNTSSGAALAGMASAALPPVGGGEGVSQAVVAAAANATVAANVVTLRFKGSVVGEWVNESPQPGMRLGWAPAPMALLAHTDAEGRLFVSDREGRRVAIPGTKNVLLPAWSMDGTQILFLQKKSATLYALVVAAVR